MAARTRLAQVRTVILQRRVRETQSRSEPAGAFQSRIAHRRVEILTAAPFCATTSRMILNICGAHADLLPERQAFLCDQAAQPIGTTTAWFEDFAGQPYGKVNWVFIVPEAQGQGLAKPLLSVIGQRLRLLGHTRALLYTLTSRLPAIHLYQTFGFVPCVRHAADRTAWNAINQHLRIPFRANERIEITTT